jgi:hypothetical protein
MDVANLKYEWLSVPVNKKQVEKLVAQELVSYFGVISDRVTLNASVMGGGNGTTLTLNMEFASNEQSAAVRSLVDTSLGARRGIAGDLSFASLDVLPNGARVVPDALMVPQVDILKRQLCRDCV